MTWNEGTPARRRRGTETFRDGLRPLGPTLQDFWAWSGSDLLGNTARGIVAEFLVAHALGRAEGVQAGWAAVDVHSPEGLGVEVKSSAYVQSWRQERPTRPAFDVGRHEAWEEWTGAQDREKKRRADVYVFALLAERDPLRVDPMDVSQWRFYVAARRTLDEHLGDRKRLSLDALLRMSPREVSFSELDRAVREVGMAAKGS